MSWIRRLFGLENKNVPVRTSSPGGGYPQYPSQGRASPPTTPQEAIPQTYYSPVATPQPPTPQPAFSPPYTAQGGIYQSPTPEEREPLSSEEAAQAAHNYVETIRKKMDQLATDFAAGSINRTQFQVLYSHYQTEISQVESMIATQPEAWETASTKGESVLLRKRFLARAQAYAIYDNTTGLPLGILGSFRLDPALVIPMLSAYRSATHEIFGSSLRLTQHENGQWLCFLSGKYTTLLAVFTDEPIARQLQYLDELHQHFERANEPFLRRHPINVNELIYPHEYFLGVWQR